MIVFKKILGTGSKRQIWFEKASLKETPLRNYGYFTHLHPSETSNHLQKRVAEHMRHSKACSWLPGRAVLGHPEPPGANSTSIALKQNVADLYPEGRWPNEDTLPETNSKRTWK